MIVIFNLFLIEYTDNLFHQILIDQVTKTPAGFDQLRRIGRLQALSQYADMRFDGITCHITAGIVELVNELIV